jgi:hypothetical protein
MKRFIFLLVMVLSFVLVNAQLATKNIVYPNTYGKIVSPTATASIYKITGTVAGNVVFYAPMPRPVTQDLTVKLDSVSGNHTNVAVALFGQKSTLKGDWTAIGSAVNWVGVAGAGLSKDTTIVISNASANRYQNFKVVFTGTGTGVTKISVVGLKLWME